MDSIWYRIIEWFIRLILLNIFLIFIPSIILFPTFALYNKFFESTFMLIILFIFLLIAIYLFLVAYITGFKVIVHYKQHKAGNIFVVFFVEFYECLKGIWKLLLMYMPFILLLLFGVYYYWTLMESFVLIGIIGFFIVFFGVLTSLIMLNRIAFNNAYIKMKTKDLIKFSWHMSFVDLHKSVLSVVFLVIPIFLVLFIPYIFVLYFVFGISISLYCMYIIVYKDYEKLVEELKTNKSFNKEEENETGN